jgi:hypothetical protein
MLQLNPKLTAVAGIVSSLIFQIASEIFYWDDDSYKKCDNDFDEKMAEFHKKKGKVYQKREEDATTPEEMNEHRREIRIIVSLTSVAETLFLYSLHMKTVNITKITGLFLIFSLTSYIAAKVGTYGFLNNRDFSILGYDRDRVW